MNQKSIVCAVQKHGNKDLSAQRPNEDVKDGICRHMTSAGKTITRLCRINLGIITLVCLQVRAFLPSVLVVMMSFLTFLHTACSCSHRKTWHLCLWSSTSRLQRVSNLWGLLVVKHLCAHLTSPRRTVHTYTHENKHGGLVRSSLRSGVINMPNKQVPVLPPAHQPSLHRHWPVWTSLSHLSARCWHHPGRQLLQLTATFIRLEQLFY